MKNFNLIKRLFMDSHEKQSPQRFGRYAVMLIMLLTLGVGQMWGDNGDFYNMYLSYTFEGASGAVDGSDNNTGVSVDAGTLTSGSLILTGVYLKCWDDWGGNYKSDGGQLCYTNKGGSTQYVTGLSRSGKSDNNYEYQKSNVGLTIASYNQASGSFSFESWGQTWGSNWGDRYFPKSSGHYTINYKIAPPAVSSYSVSTTGSNILSGSGTSGDPYIIAYNGTLSLSISGSKHHTDGNSSAQYYNTSSSDAWSGTSTKSITSITSTTKTSVTVKMRYYNSTAKIGGTESSTTIYYKSEASYNVTAAKTPSAGGSVTPTSATKMGTTSGGNITASANTGYTFTSWAITSGSGYFGASGTATTSTTANTKFRPSAATTVTATFTPKTYSITLDGNGGSDGSATATYNSSTLTSVTSCSRASYDLNGYYTATSGGTKVINANGTLVASVSTYTNSSSQWIKDADVELHAQWTYNPVTYSVTYAVGTGYTSYGSLSAKNTSTSAAISSGSSVESGTGVTFTATPNTGYVVEGWYTNAACTSGKHDAGSTTYSTTLSGNITVYVKFVEKTWSVAFAAGTGGTVTTPAATPQTVGQITGISIAATPATGYTFNTWTITSGSGSFTSSATTNSNKFKPTAASTITASFNETKSTITVTTATSSQGTLKFGSTSKSWGTTASLGVATTQEITATAAAGFRFVRWDLTGAAASASSLTSATITLKADGSGSTGTATAVFEEDLSSPWIVAGGNKIVTTGTTWRKTADANNSMVKKTGHSTESVVYFTVPVTTVCSGDNNGNFQFKIYNTSTSTWYSLGAGGDSYYLLKAEDGTAKSLVTDGKNIELRAYVTGDYEFKLDYSSTPTLTVTWPVFNQVRISAASPTDATNTGNFDLSDPVSNVRTITRSLKANTTYTFKIMYNSDWYGYNSGTFTRNNSTSSNSRTISTSGGNMTLTTDYAGDYTFKFNQSTKALSVDFPAAYKITFGKGSVDGTTGSFSAVDLDNGNSAVTSNSTWVKSGDDVKITAPDAKSGYRFLGWYDNDAATGDAITTNANCTISVTAATTVYACYAENLTSITVSAGTGGTVTTGSGTSNLGVTTTKAINASANPGYTWSTWTISGTAALGTTATTASNTAKGNGTNGSTGTITATFTPNPYTITLEKHNGQSDGSINVTFDANTNLTGTAVTAPTKTGYTFGGYYTGESGAGTKIINADGTVVASASDASYTYTDASKNWKYPNNITLHAKWTAKTYTVTLDYDETNHGDITTTPPTGSITATYDAAMPAIAILPKAAEGYAFMGYYSAAGGSGTQYYDGTGASVTNWNVDDEITLYAYYKQAEITSVTFDYGIVEPGATITATANIDPDPAGTTTVCWRLLHDNGNEYSPQPTFTPASGATVSFTVPETSTFYKVEAKLRTGNDCSGGTLLDTEIGRFQVAGSHTVTVYYKNGANVIKASTSVTANPLDWSGDITAPDIFGYTFSSWSSVDGVTIKDSEHTDVTSSEEATIKIKATYNGSLTANYTPKNIIYFKDNLEWTDPEDADAHIYLNLLTGDYWNTDNGTGNDGVTNRNLEMSRVPGTTDIFYYDYGSKPTTNYVSFTKESMNGYTHFYQSTGKAHVVFPSRALDALGTNNATGLGFYAATPMFVPLATQTPVQKNSNHAEYYNDGYWTKYLPGTGYSLDIYQSDGSTHVKTIAFTSADELMPMKVVTDLEGGHTYKFQLKRDGDVYYGNSGTMTYEDHGQNTPWDFFHNPFSKCSIVTNAAGNYTFNLSYSPNSGGTNNRLRMSVDYPVADGDYRLLYSDAVQTKPLTSAIVNKVNDGSDTVSFFVRPGSTPVLRIQQASIVGSTVTWKEYPTIGTPTNQIAGAIATALTSGGTDVYNFNLSMNGSGALSVASVEKYEGNYYIRTDAANSKWDNYRTDPDHRMTYSEYSIEHGGYTHYYTHWVNKDDVGRKNVKFVIANDYSPNISDTLTRETAEGTWANIDDFMTTGGDLKRSANVRFMWDKRSNAISRAYVDGAQGDYSSNFLYMLNVEDGADKIQTKDATALTDHKVTFKDNGNWMYEANIKAQPTAQIKLLSNWGTENTITQYFRGTSDDTETLLGGSGSTWYDIRVIYDFKTNRLIAGLIPSGTIDEQMAIHADVMFIREHHGDIAQLTFAEKDSKMGAITDIETAYGVLQLNKWTLNNKSKADGHAPLSPLLSQYERDLFYISFPFRVSMEEVFGFGTYGQHWIIEEYDGASRAANGYWQESGPNWKFVFNRKNKFFEPGTGYIIALDLDEMGERADIWANTDQVELYFPSYGTMDNITSSTATYNIPAHECTINRSNEPKPGGGTLGSDYDRRVKDSHWNVLGVPTYVNPEAPEFANTDWITTATETSVGPNFLYEWNKDNNTVTAVSASGYRYHAMHAYLVQYYDEVTWTSSVSVTPSSIVARRTYEEAPKSVEFRLELMQDAQAIDQTFVKLSDNEAVTTSFEFNYDLSKEFNNNKANIYTLIGTEQVAGNVLPLTEQTTVVPVGVKIATNGDYTFSMPDGTEGIGVTLIDNETGIRTSLSALDYTVFLEAGTYDGRFIIEISPLVGVWTDVKQAVSDQSSDVRKVIIDQQMYIIKDGKMFDARGAVVK